ncbi:proline-rich protein 23C-like [Physeter macrocephalus]|uniref:Proline-rich protein 23C-like n=1 Tax=Physeter macrocephalus TaxID=9755 RepID=A0A2Y9FAT7_PHYMC|nr:proline-rich protein 23C-like [Physeter catodon]|eukprot:XP_007117538.1 proline-rich protein 23C-like [Physeter catodon]
MGSQPRSPSAYPADRWGPQTEGPGSAKRRRTEEPEGPESESEAAPSLDNLTGHPAADALTSVVVLPAGCALHLPLDDVDVLLEPEPTSVRQVSLGDHILMLVPEALLGSGVEGPWVQGLERAGFLSAPGEYMALEPGFLCAAVPQIASQEEANKEEAEAEFLPSGMDGEAGSVAGLRSPTSRVSGPGAQGFVPEPWPREPNHSPERGSPHHDDNLDLHLLEPFPDSPLQPLPPSPSPGPHERPQRPHGPARKAQRCLFPE